MTKHYGITATVISWKNLMKVEINLLDQQTSSPKVFHHHFHSAPTSSLCFIFSIVFSQSVLFSLSTKKVERRVKSQVIHKRYIILRPIFLFFRSDMKAYPLKSRSYLETKSAELRISFTRCKISPSLPNYILMYFLTGLLFWRMWSKCYFWAKDIIIV